MKRQIITVVATVLITSVVMLPIGAVLAEKVGATPESGVTSRIKTLYDILVGEDKGADTAGDWGDWGAFWNRIYSATRYTEVDYELQALVEWDDCEGDACNGEGEPEDYQGEEAEWTNTFPLDNGKEVWKDERTGLYWSHTVAASMTNVFPDQDHSTCPFFDGNTEAEKLPARYNYDGGTPACGNAINACAGLSIKLNTEDTEEYTKWYLPTQKELIQGYIDGIVNQTSFVFTTPNWFWSS